MPNIEHWKNHKLSSISEMYDGVLYIEEWRPIVSHMGKYEISSFGRVKALEREVIINRGAIRMQPTRIMKQQIDRKGYCYITLPILKKKNPKERSKKYKIHRLVGLAFLKRKRNQNEINHIYGVKHDNRWHQLEWSTHKDNVIDSYKKGIKIGKRGEESHYSKFKKEDILMIRKLNNEKVSRAEIAIMFRTSQGYISDICLKRTWKHI